MTPLSSTDVYQVLRNYFRDILYNPGLFKHQVLVSDNSYFSAPSASDIQGIIRSDPVLLPSKYRRNIFDCDDYALYLKTKMSLIAANTAGQTRSFAFGYLITDKHAFNFGIGDTKNLFIINTQSNDQAYLYPTTENQLSAFLGLNQQNNIKAIYI